MKRPGAQLPECVGELVGEYVGGAGVGAGVGGVGGILGEGVLQSLWGHRVHALCAFFDVFPLAQKRHDEELYSEAYFPTGQSIHAFPTNSDSGWNFPQPHSAQNSSWYVNTES